MPIVDGHIYCAKRDKSYNFLRSQVPELDPDTNEYDCNDDDYK